MSSAAGQDRAIVRISQIMGELFPEHAWAEATFAALNHWLSMLLEWNRKINLTAARTDDELFDLFIADAVVLHCARIDVGLSHHWLDVGTGAGAPGLAMAVLDPALSIDLVEPNAKRVAFLRQIVGRLGLRQATVRCARVEDLPVSMADDVVSRATWAPDNWLARGMPLARQRLWMLLARADWKPDSDVVVVYDRIYQWPLTRAERRVIAVTRAQTHKAR
jgi:16S rRNA (guanine527-N7)-methyltransferase